MNETEHLLTILGEEASEIIQRASKVMRFTPTEIQPGHDQTNWRRLEQEYADLIVVAERLGLKVHEEDKEAKRVKLSRFMAYSRQIGTLDA